MRETPPIEREKITVQGVEMYDHGSAWGVVVGVRTFMFDKEAFEGLPPAEKEKLLKSIKDAQEASMAGESVAEKLEPALEVVKKFGL